MRTAHTTRVLTPRGRARAQADLDNNGCLDADELKSALKNPQFVDTAMSNMDLDLDGKISLREWLIAQKTTCDKSEVACKTALKMHEKALLASKAKRVV